MQFSLLELLRAGGVILIVLIAASVYSLAVIFERWNFFRKQAGAADRLAREAARYVKNGDARRALDGCRHAKNIAGDVLAKVLESSGSPEERRAYAAAVISYQEETLHKRLSFLATIGSTTPFVGLLGTVIGVIRAFKDLAGYSGAGPSVVAAGIAEALVNTAAGLFVAIPAILAYNYFISRANNFTREMEWASEEIIAAQQRQAAAAER